MKKKSLLDSIDVPIPCDKSWDEMIGDDVSRLCLHCDKDIFNISAMTRQEAKKLLFQSKEKVCIRMEREPDGRIKTLKKQLHQITRQMPLAAGVLTASMILAGTTNSQEQKTETPKIIITQIADKHSKPTISGTITDSNGAVIPGVKIILLNTKNNSTKTTTSDGDGLYEFKDVTPSVYKIETKDRTGFKDFIYLNLTVEPDKNINFIITLEPKENAEVVGLVSSAETPVTTETPQIDTKITPRQIESLPINSRKLPVLGLFPGVKQDETKKHVKTSQISFTIFDMIGQVIPDAEVKLTNKKTEQTFTTKTNNKGFAYFSLLPRGKYEVKASMQGFRNGMISLIISEKIEPNIEIILEVGTWTGVVSINWSEIPTFNAIIQDDYENVKKSINSGFGVNTTDSSGKTALHFAVREGNLKIIKLLLAKGAKVNAKDRLGRTPLIMIDSDDEEHGFEILRLLIAKGADVNIRDKDENNATLLMNVCEDNNFELAKILLEAGANPNLKDDDGETAIQKTKSEEIKKILIKYGAKPIKKAETRP